jgi:predicted DNA-binding transcriptional regulator AlpA
MDRLLDQKTAAKLLGLSVRTLERHRLAGTGPCYARLGRLIRYRERDLDDWVQASLRTSTSDAPRPDAR